MLTSDFFKPKFETAVVIAMNKEHKLFLKINREWAIGVHL